MRVPDGWPPLVSPRGQNPAYRPTHSPKVSDLRKQPRVECLWSTSVTYAHAVDKDADAEAETGRPPLPGWGKFARQFFLKMSFGLYPLLVILDDVTSGSLDDSGPWSVVRGIVAVSGLVSGFVWAFAAFRVPLPWWGRTAQVLCLAFSLFWFVRGLLALFFELKTGDFVRYGPLVATAVFGVVWAFASGFENRTRSQAQPGGRRARSPGD